MDCHRNIVKSNDRYIVRDRQTSFLYRRHRADGGKIVAGKYRRWTIWQRQETFHSLITHFFGRISRDIRRGVFSARNEPIVDLDVVFRQRIQIALQPF